MHRYLFHIPLRTWARGLLTEMTAFLAFLGALFALTALIVWVL
jgi:hypothetical protein